MSKKKINLTEYLEKEDNNQKKIIFYSFGADFSKRLKGKNYKKLCGKELCRYTFDFINKLKKFYSFQYWIFTDSNIIVDIINNYYNDFKIYKCSKEEREGLKGSQLVHKVCNADFYFKFPFTNPIRDIDNIRQNIDICLNGNFNQAYMYNIKNLFSIKPTGSMHFWKKQQLNNPIDYNTIILPDWFAFDIDYQEDFNEVERFIEKNKWEYNKWV